MVTLTEQFDVVVIGGGPGGYGTALYGAAAGLNIALVENRDLGGTCLNRGCIPAKELLESASVFRTVAGASEFGVIANNPTVDAAALMARKDQVVNKLVGGVTGLLKSRKVTVFAGTGHLGANRTVVVTATDGTTTEITGNNVVLATGSVPRSLPGFDVDGTVVLTSDEVFEMTTIPERIAIIGAGVVGAEFASVFGDLGSKVTLLEAMPAMLPGADPDVIRPVQRAMTKRGIDIRLNVSVSGHTPTAHGTTLHFNEADDLEVDAVVVAIGRRPMSDDLVGPESSVVVDGRGFIEVDEWCRTAESGVFAVGDVIATPGLAHVGFAEAILVVKQIIGEATVPVDYDRVPWCVYTHPEVAYCGLSEAAAKEAGFDVVTAKHPWGGTSRALIIGDVEGTMKIIAERKADGSAGQVLGVHMSGPWVTEQLGQGYLAVNWEATVDDVAHFIQPHPTLSENFGETMLSLAGRGLHS